MSKNKLLWNIALFLMAISSLPIAHAQTFIQAFVESRLFFILVNSAIVFIILFVLQSFLIQDKDPKQKTAVWVVIIGASLVIGFLYGQSTYIWWTYPFGLFFDYHVLGNTAIIAAVLYFILGYFQINQKLGTQGKTGYGILLFLISAILAVQLGPNWIWQAKEYGGYFFGEQGVFRRPKLYVFLGSFVLMAYFFVGYLTKGREIKGGTFINYSLAFLLAMSMANAGMGFKLVVRIGELVLLIVISDALEGKVADGKHKWWLAFLIVGWASASLTAFGPDYQGIIGGFMTPMLRYYELIPTPPDAPTGFGPVLFHPITILILVIAFAMDVVGKEGTWTDWFGSWFVIGWFILVILNGLVTYGWADVAKIALYGIGGIFSFILIIGSFILVGWGFYRLYLLIWGP